MAEEGAALVRDSRITLVLTTAPDSAVGEKLIERLLEERLIACGNLVPGVRSLYHWEGSIVRESEVLILMKAEAAAVGRLFRRISDLHPYSVPELIELPVVGVSEAYSRWVMQSTGMIE
jgi:periplasmic divalent cation tolerance protein